MPDHARFHQRLLRAFLRDVNWVLSVHSEMNFEIERRFREEGVQITRVVGVQLSLREVRGGRSRHRRQGSRRCLRSAVPVAHGYRFGNDANTHGGLERWYRTRAIRAM